MSAIRQLAVAAGIILGFLLLASILGPLVGTVELGVLAALLIGSLVVVLPRVRRRSSSDAG